MPVYWLKYRDDLYKKVTLYQDPVSIPKDPLRKKVDAKKILSILPEEDECYSGFERMAAKTEDGRAQCNIRRAARQIEAYALCNDWPLFATFTLNAKKHNRSDLDEFRETFVKFICNQRRSHPDLAYLIVPELHSDGENWHMHGLVSGLPKDALRAFTLKEKPTKRIRNKLKEGHAVYEWESYRESFGWNTLEPVISPDRVARYITKYITKDVMKATAKSIDTGKHLYFHSRGLVVPELVGKIENTSGWYPEALSNDLILDSSYDWPYGEVQWYKRPHK